MFMGLLYISCLYLQFIEHHAWKQAPTRGGLFNPPRMFKFWHDVQHNVTNKTLQRGTYPVALRLKSCSSAMRFASALNKYIEFGKIPIRPRSRTQRNSDIITKSTGIPQATCGLTLLHYRLVFQPLF